MAVGMRPPRRGLFGNPVMGAQAPLPTSPMQPAPQDRLAAVTAPQEPMQPEKPKADWAGRLAALGALLQGNMGGVMAYHQNQRQAAMQRQQALAAEQNYQRQRADEFTDWKAREQWKLDNPGPAGDDRTAFQKDYEYMAQNFGPEVAEQFARTKYEAPPMVVQNPDGTRTIYPAGAIPRGQPTGELPTFSPDDWDKGQPMGGGVSNGTGGFQ